jgi:hypothetical protein
VDRQRPAHLRKCEGGKNRPSDPMTLGERVVVISFVVALVLVTAFGVFAFMFPEQLPWYGDPSPRTPLPRSSLWEGLVT